MVVSQILGSAVHAFGIRTGESPKYDVIHEDGELEIRRYQALLRVKTFAPGVYAASLDTGFARLLSFMSGHNDGGTRLRRSKPAMRSSTDGERITMTTPVLHAAGQGGWTVAFILPRKYSFSTAPRPLDAEVELEQVPPQTMAILRYSGHVDEVRVQRKFRELRGWVQSIGWRSISEPLAAQYDPPFTISFLKRNEVLVRAEPLHS